MCFLHVKVLWFKSGADIPEISLCTLFNFLQCVLSTLLLFAEHRLKGYSTDRNDPNKSVASNMSPYLHFGQIGAQAMVLRVKGANKHHSSADAFVEESVVRRELSDNFCFCKLNFLLFMYCIWSTNVVNTLMLFK